VSDLRKDRAPACWRPSRPPWPVGHAPSFVAPLGDGVIAIVPERSRRQESPVEHSFLLRLGGDVLIGADPLAYIPTGTTDGTTVAVSGGQRPVRLRRLNGSFFVDEWEDKVLHWQERVAVPAYAGSALVGLTNRRVLIIGGFSQSKDEATRTVSDVTLVDLRDCSVMSMEPLIQPRGGCSAFVLGQERVFVVGGHIGELPTKERVETPTTELFDQARASWEQGPALRKPRMGAQTTQLSNGDVLVAGGGNDAGRNALRSCELYDAKEQRWREVCPLPIGRSYGSLCGLPDGNAILTGGTSRGIEWPDEATATAWLYNSVRDIWTQLPDMDHKRFAPLSSPLGNESVIVVDNGVLTSSQTLRPVEVLSLQDRQ